jgi:hypothetical protein
MISRRALSRPARRARGPGGPHTDLLIRGYQQVACGTVSLRIPP